MPTDATAAPAGLLRLTAVAVVAGLVTGLVASSFGLLLDAAARLRTDLAAWAGESPGLRVPLVVVVVVASVLAAALLVHRVEPHAEGSGIPRVEAAVRGDADPGRLRVVPVKYVGGLLAIGGGGLALGREGPSVHMGGVIGAWCARHARLGPAELRMVVAGGAAAGLATAFSAPIAGGVFVLEELLQRFDHRTTLATLAASGAGFVGSRALGSDVVVFDVPALSRPDVALAPLVLLVGLVCALLAVGYTRAVLAGLRVADASRIPLVVRVGLIGVVAALLAVAQPGWVGSGDDLTETALAGRGTAATVAGLLVVRLLFSVLSYAATTPGGLFAPMLVLGSHAGLLVALLADRVWTLPADGPAALALVGMAAFFTASVQAPVTGLVLATEMTGSVAWLAPMLGAAAVALLVARVLGSAPIYDALEARSARNARANRAEHG